MKRLVGLFAAFGALIALIRYLVNHWREYVKVKIGGRNEKKTSANNLCYCGVFLAVVGDYTLR